jgi:UDP-glucose 4-epimerase
MRVLVTGASTGLGTALLARLHDDPRVEKILAVGLEPRSTGTFPGARSEWVAMDVRRSRDLRTLLFGRVRELEIDTVVHMAEHVDPHDGGSSVHALNVDRTRELLHLLGRHPTIRKLVYRGHAQVYRVDGETPTMLDEEQPLDMSPRAPQWLRDRVEADQAVCTQLGLSPAQITVLRCAEIYGPGNQTWDYLQSRVCFHPLGFDPMIELLTLEDAAHALQLALHSPVHGIFNIPGNDILPLSAVTRQAGRRSVGVPRLLLPPLYRWRRRVLGTLFKWELNDGRYRWSGLLDGTRAARILGYAPEQRIRW